MTIQKLTGITPAASSLFVCFLLVTGIPAAATDNLAENCANCHGKDGVSRESDVPTIAGYSAPYLTDSLAAYKKKERPCPETKYRSGDKKETKTDMCQITRELSYGEIKELGQHFAGKTFVRASQKFDDALAQKGKVIHERSCELCHSKGGSLASDDAGILAGQWMPYLEESFKEFRSGHRPIPKMMKPKIEMLDKEAVNALLHYYASFK
jgi:sulfide dehydrogenase cytochrome subunit